MLSSLNATIRLSQVFQIRKLGEQVFIRITPLPQPEFIPLKYMAAIVLAMGF
jgi:hypothetical protein